ncbi:nose resistant to fluoxetine protein 6-like [Oppia nitens]|uniref:nose resistant to fluoxetine protein 6-like n=1 Tax=Oppia nitens TaxID=1686743 RepID=UPI0023DBFA31|nr:nose resistant to fluoxetine protein 6-like [Oppia nitens]
MLLTFQFYYKCYHHSYINQTLQLLNNAIIINNNTLVDDTGDRLSIKCIDDINQVIIGARNGQYWANHIIDSMGRPNSGILRMSLSFLGEYSQCLDTEAPNFQTQYCLATIQLPKSDSHFLYQLTSYDWHTLSKVPVKLGICMPSSCTTSMVTKLTNSITSNLISNSSVLINKCYKRSDNNIETDISSIAMICVASIIMVLIICGTLCDHYKLESQSQLELLYSATTGSQKIAKPYETYEDNTKPLYYNILLSFSLKTNAKKIFDTNSTDSTIQVFHGIKVLSMLWILIGHSFAFAVQWMTFRNPVTVLKVPQNILSQLLANGTFSVDCFLFISGFLVSYLVMRNMSRYSGTPNILMLYLNRYLRMTPAMMAVIAFSATLLKYLGSGPQWSESITMFNQWCQTNWWINSLYLHNFINTNNMCLSHSWYSAVDMQLYIMSPIILIPLYLKPKLGLTLALLVLMSSMIFTGYLSFANGFPAVPYFSDVIDQQVVNQYYGLLYIKPYCRLGPYLVGIVLAYFIYTSQRDIKLKKVWVSTGWVLSVVTSLSVLFAMFQANNGNVPEVHFAALYSATSRTIWSLSLAWTTFACINGYGGLVGAFLSSKLWVPFSRLTHCAYLIHPIVMAVLYGTRQHSFDFSNYLFIYLTIGHILITYVMALIVSLAIESPFIAISKLLLAKRLHS